MSKPNYLSYRMAQERVASGKWRIDYAAGHIIGALGEPMLRKAGDSGYIRITFREPGNREIQHGVQAHRVIWEAAHGPIPAGLEINHINGVKDDNRLANLEAVTPSENMYHANRTGLRRAPRGADCARGRFTNAFVLDIYRRAAVEPAVSIANEHGVSVRAVSDIRSGRTWRHVTGARHQAAASTRRGTNSTPHTTRPTTPTPSTTNATDR